MLLCSRLISSLFLFHIYLGSHNLTQLFQPLLLNVTKMGLEANRLQWCQCELRVSLIMHSGLSFYPFWVPFAEPLFCSLESLLSQEVCRLATEVILALLLFMLCDVFGDCINLMFTEIIEFLARVIARAIVPRPAHLCNDLWECSLVL